jgi:hypothetical protein
MNLLVLEMALKILLVQEMAVEILLEKCRDPYLEEKLAHTVVFLIHHHLYFPIVKGVSLAFHLAVECCMSSPNSICLRLFYNLKTNVILQG